MTVIDVASLMRTYLLANSTLATAVANRIWVGKVPEDEMESMPRKAVLLLPSSSIPVIPVPVYKVRYDTYCYGATELGAWEVYQDVYDAVHRCGYQTVSTSNKIMQAVATGGPTARVEAIMGWPSIWSAFTVTWLEREIT